MEPSVTSPADYLAFERAAEERHEFIDGRIVALSRGSFAHAVTAGNIAGELGTALRDRPCRICPASLRLKIEVSERYTYADVAVVCGTPRFDDDRRDTLLNPSALFEVLSDSTEGYDRCEKFAHYRTSPRSPTTSWSPRSRSSSSISNGRTTEAGCSERSAWGNGFAFPSLGCEVAVDGFYLKVFVAQPED